jgi:hypothetical protein
MEKSILLQRSMRPVIAMIFSHKVIGENLFFYCASVPEPVLSLPKYGKTFL